MNRIEVKTQIIVPFLQQILQIATRSLWYQTYYLLNQQINWNILGALIVQGPVFTQPHLHLTLTVYPDWVNWRITYSWLLTQEPIPLQSIDKNINTLAKGKTFQNFFLTMNMKRIILGYPKINEPCLNVFEVNITF